jgi:putative zinc finger/helix-turn-helix YgiT family protein
MAVRSFPHLCAECGKEEVWPTTISYDAEVKHDGRIHAFAIHQLHVNKCAACGEVFFDHATDEQISTSLRDHLGLLSPQEIRDQLTDLGLTQKEFGAQISVAPETISRWLSGAYIQSRSSDKLMRLFFEKAKRKARATGEVVIPDGELVPWGRSVSYEVVQQLTPPEAASLDITAELKQGDMALAA